MRVLIIMGAAIFCRMVDMGSVRTRADSANGSAAGAAGDWGAGAAGAGAAAAGCWGAGAAGGGSGEGVRYVWAACDDMYASTSLLVMRPPSPVPFTFDRSMLNSRPILRTRGDNGPCSSSPSGCATGGGGAGAAA